MSVSNYLSKKLPSTDGVSIGCDELANWRIDESIVADLALAGLNLPYSSNDGGCVNFHKQRNVLNHHLLFGML